MDTNIALFDNIPTEIKEKARWVLWKLETVDNKLTKVPYQVNGDKASTTDSKTWNSYESCLLALGCGEFRGLGFVFSDDDNLMGVDWDHIRNTETGEFEAGFLEEIHSLGSYGELSQSGNGAHVILKGTKPGTRCRRIGQPREMYERDRFFVMTGNHILETPGTVEYAQVDAIQQIYNHLQPVNNNTTPTPETIPTVKAKFKDSEIIRMCREAKNGDKFISLWNGNISDYQADESAADMALCNLLAYRTKEPIQIDRIFRQSGLCRDKWLNRPDYRNRTIEAALASEIQQETPKEEPENVEVPEHIKERARQIAETGNPLDFILRTHQTLHVGDIGIAASLLLSATCQHIVNTDGIQPKLSGGSGKGKSDCAKGVAHIIPQEWIITASLSDKAIYYMGDDLRPGSIIFCDDVALSEDLEKVINRATTFYQTGAKHVTVDSNRRKLTLRIPARIGWWLTSIDDDQSIQTLNRTFGGEVDESEEQDFQVMQMQIKKASLGEEGLPLTDDVLTCREIIRDIKEQLYRVKIPYAYAIRWRDMKNRRNLPIFLDIIKALAVLRHRQRETDVSDGCLVADLQDFVDAKQLYTSREQAQGTKLTASERKLCDILRRNGAEMSYQTLADAMGVGENRITQILNGKGKGHDSGLKHKATGIHVERRTEQNNKGGYTTKNYVLLSTGYDPLAGFDEVVSIDYSNLPSYHELTPNLPFKNTNGKRELTLLTLIEREDPLQGVVVKDPHSPQKMKSYPPLSQEKGKKGKFPASDSENEKVSFGKNSAENYQPIAEIEKGKFPTKKVSFDQSINKPAHTQKWLSQWEQVNRTTINSQNYKEAATEYATKHSADLSEVLYLTCKYAGLEEVQP